jgi:hypothetical protein
MDPACHAVWHQLGISPLRHTPYDKQRERLKRTDVLPFIQTP